MRGATNHWWRVALCAEIFVVKVWSDETEVVADEPLKELHFCSEGCVSKRLSEFMGGK